MCDEMKTRRLTQGPESEYWVMGWILVSVVIESAFSKKSGTGAQSHSARDL